MLLKIILVYVVYAGDTYAWDDSYQYLQLSDSLPHFSQIYPVNISIVDIQRVPLYPIFLRILGNHPLLILGFQSLLQLGTAYYLVQILKKFTRYASYIGIVYLFLPSANLFSLLLLSETLFLFFLILTLYYWQQQRPIFCGLSLMPLILTRPNGIVVWIALSLIVVSRLYKKETKLLLKSWFILTIMMSVGVGAWIWRNHQLSGQWQLSSLSDNTLIHGRLGGLLCYQQKLPYTDDNLVCTSETYLIQQGIYPLKTYYSVVHQQETELYTSVCKKAALSYIFNHFGDYISFQGVCFIQLYKGLGYKSWKRITHSIFVANILATIQGIYVVLSTFVLLWSCVRWRQISFFTQWVIISILLTIILSLLPFADTRYRLPIDILTLLLWNDFMYKKFGIFVAD